MGAHESLAQLKAIARKYGFEIIAQEKNVFPKILGGDDRCLVFSCEAVAEEGGRYGKYLRVSTSTSRMADETPTSLRSIADELRRAADFLEEVNGKRLSCADTTRKRI